MLKLESIYASRTAAGFLEEHIRFGNRIWLSRNGLRKANLERPAEFFSTRTRQAGKIAIFLGVFQAWTKGQQFTDTCMPWLLNALFASATVKPGEGGSWIENFPWAEEFKQIQVRP